MEKCLQLNKTQFNEEILDFFISSKEDIIKRWIIYPTLFDILKEFDISHEYYSNNVATPVYDYFTTIISGENEPGDCPVMRKVIEIFYEKGFQVEDVFLSCTAFKNVLNTKLYEKKIDQTIIINLMMILDSNLSSILSIYSHKMEEKEDIIQRHNDIIQNHVLLTITDDKGYITHVTEAFCLLSGFKKEELIGKTHNILSDPDESLEFFQDLWDTISTGNKWQGKIKNFTKDNEPFILDTVIIPVKNNNNEIIEYMAIRENITDREVFQYDVLTKIFTRRIFDEKFDELLEFSRNTHKTFSMIIGDIDHFKNVNDTYGHNKGDEILRDFAQIIQKNIRLNDMCFRWGGEEFVILLPSAQLNIATRVANKIREDFSAHQFIENKKLTASFGITQMKTDDTKESLFKRADEALYYSKTHGRDQIKVI